MDGKTSEREQQIPDSGFRRAPIGVFGRTEKGLLNFRRAIMKGAHSEFPRVI